MIGAGDCCYLFVEKMHPFFFPRGVSGFYPVHEDYLGFGGVFFPGCAVRLFLHFCLPIHLFLKDRGKRRGLRVCLCPGEEQQDI